VGLVAVVAAAMLTWFVQGGSGSGDAGSPSATSTSVASTIAAAELPVEAQDTLRLIDAGGPFPSDRDGVVFENRERLLPLEATGYYHEYTVPTPGSADRGARRIITGGPADDPDVYYWTEDHYRSFERIER
jgi:ribonuclease T1